MSFDEPVSFFKSPKIIKTNGQWFTFEEDVAVCNALLSVLEDLRDGNIEPNFNIGDGIFQKFVACTNNESRSQDSVQSRWENIMKCCFKFNAYLKQIKSECHKGLTEYQMANQAKLLYVEYEKEQFIMDHCWEILQHRINWQNLADTKKPNSPTKTTDSFPQSSNTPTRTTDSYAQSSNTPPWTTDSYAQSSRFTQIADVPFPTEEYDQTTCRGCCHSPISERSSGWEIEQERARGKARIMDPETSSVDDLIEQLNRQARKAEMRKVHLEEKRFHLAKKMQELEEKQVAVKQQERDDAVMFMDTSKMDHQAQLYWAMRKDEIIAKAYNRLNISG
ncbi:hypothetical protein Vadar_026435 [Vaccinium darrowii]|uniref:Uncharacterized protein n=1 Tax=Vaccinium darrowii TaxID=229202 RepID=A0ACB7Y2N4_9ERIC|nr:hypothetical protein Vadar_026435 [Vaccinium darrowii]